MEWSTVVWCLPPKARPISGRDAAVRLFHQKHRDLSGIRDPALVRFLLQLGGLQVVALGYRFYDGFNGDLAFLAMS